MATRFAWSNAGTQLMDFINLNLLLERSAPTAPGQELIDKIVDITNDFRSGRGRLHYSRNMRGSDNI